MPKLPPSRARLAAVIGTALLAVLAPLPRVNAENGPSRFAIATENEASARAALQTLEQGGSAVDAAIAASAMLDVTAPVSCGIGGGGFALVYEAKTKKTTVIDYRETAPALYDAATRRSKAHGAPVGVPGEIAGLAFLHERWGKRSLSEDLAPAASAADSGFTVSKHLAKMLGERPEYFVGTPLGAIFAPQNALTLAGDRVRIPALGATLKRVGSEGRKAFYEGAVAAEIIDVARAAGSPIQASDLAGYRAVLREPLVGRWEGYEIATMPPPSAGGLMLLETLGTFSKAELAAMGYGTANSMHMLAEAMRGAIADRMRVVGDPAFVPDRTREL
ncbi:MAG TPA: gamma-glutamyltransferase, partial [Polyangiaceae bacterium]|nr:gamma-glutamyltransferase [Polyangiaceae bacterium]